MKIHVYGQSYERHFIVAPPHFRSVFSTIHYAIVHGNMAKKMLQNMADVGYHIIGTDIPHIKFCFVVV